MRNNHPVTNTEAIMKENSILISKTNLKGVITDVNAEFVDISGFTKEELIGKNHNLVRHPDMPIEAFKDLWNTVKSGKPWVGLVKNRCKNGDYYWVTANVAPVTEEGRVVGYISVRHKPSRQEVNAAEKLYSDARKGYSSLKPSFLSSMMGVLWNNRSVTQRLLGIMSLIGMKMAFMTYNFEQLIRSGADADSLVTALTYGAAGSFLILLVTVGVFIRAGVLPSIRASSKVLSEIAEGNFKSDIDIKRGDELGDILRSAKMLQIRQGSMVNDARYQLNLAARIQSALDSTTANVMMADNQHNIIYINNTLQGMLDRSESNFKQKLPHFDAKNLMGSCIDIFHEDPAYQRRILDGLTTTFASPDMNLGGTWVKIIANPVFDAEGNRIATVTEWLDRTQDVALENMIEHDIKGLVEAAKQGQLSRRIDLSGTSGQINELSQLLNELLDVSEQGIGDIIQGLKALEEGNLVYRISNDYQGMFDEAKQANNSTADQISKVMGHVRMTAEQVAMGANEIANGNHTLSARTQEQAAALEETAASIEEITGTVQQTSDNSLQANKLAREAVELAKQGGGISEDAVTAMTEINANSKKISDIIGVIDEISFQTNLLALNAAVEAARAGEQGRGFAVVAGEVRALAQRSAGAAKEIKVLINQSVQSVESGSKLVNESGSALQNIVEAVTRVGVLVAEIDAASSEQSAGIDQINRAIAQLDSNTQQNSALVEESASASGHLNGQASDLRQQISQFQLDDSELDEDEVSQSDENHSDDGGKIKVKKKVKKIAKKRAKQQVKAMLRSVPEELVKRDDDVWEEI